MKNTKNDEIKIIMAFDFGMKRIGVAVGQTITHSARPLDTLPAKAGVPNWSTIARLIEKWAPDALIVGIPLNMNGTHQAITFKAEAFAQQLQEHYSIPVYKMDERLTTKDAREKLFSQGGYKALQDGQVDQVAAQLILQNWFAEHIKK